MKHLIAPILMATSSLDLAQQKTVTVSGNFTGQDQQSFQKVINAFEAKNPGIKANYTDSTYSVTLINVRVQAGNHPDIKSGRATNWLESILLRTAPASVYDRWITNKVKFDSPEVRKAWGVLDDIVTTPGYVYGGKTTAVNLAFWKGTTDYFTGKNLDQVLKDIDAACSK